MKKSEIEAIITTSPTAVFRSHAKYQGAFIVVGFVKEARSKYASPTWYAETKSVHFDEKTNTSRVGNYVSKKSLAVVGYKANESLDAFNAQMTQSTASVQASKAKKAATVEVMNEIKPQIARALQALNIDNKARNYGDETTFKIELDVDNADALLALLNTIAAAQVQ